MTKYVERKLTRKLHLRLVNEIVISFLDLCCICPLGTGSFAPSRLSLVVRGYESEAKLKLIFSSEQIK